MGNRDGMQIHNAEERLCTCMPTNMLEMHAEVIQKTTACAFVGDWGCACVRTDVHAVHMRMYV